MLTVYQSYSLHTLFDKLQEDLLCALQMPEHSLFDKTHVLVQSPAMQKWLQVNLAKNYGVLANVEFPMPASFFWRLYKDILNKHELDQHNSYSKQAMTWRLMHIIDDHFNELPQHTQRYMQTLRRTFHGHATNNNEQQANLLQFQFCQTIADVFDQYLVFRPEWIRQWESETASGVLYHHWQAQLWRLLVKYDSSHSPLAHRARLNDLALSQLKQQPLTNNGSIEHLFVFGLSSMPAQYLALLHALSQHTCIHMYVQNPSLHYYGDIQSRKKQAWIFSHQPDVVATQNLHFCEGNPLLAAMGMPIKEFSEQLLEQAPDSLEYLDDLDNANEQQAPCTHLLAHTQYEIRHLEYAGISDNWHQAPITANFNLSHNDDSLLIHNCHSRLRELQVLHNQLLHFFDTLADLQASDILIMSPKPADYAPYIHAVFGTNPKQAGFIPCVLNESVHFFESSIIESFFSILNIGQQRFKASAIVALIKQPAIYQRWNFNEVERQQLEYWITNEGVYWSWDAVDKQQWQLPISEKFTWKQGIKRSCLGLMLDNQTHFQGLLPANIDTTEQAQLLGRFFDFLSSLRDTEQRLQAPRCIDEWITLFNQITREFFSTEQITTLEPLLALQNALSCLKDDIQHSSYQHNISLPIIKNILKEHLSKPQQSFQLHTGKVNFTSLLPMRGIPFRVICLLGMNDGEYPHPNTHVEFNLIDEQPRQLGDRSRREEDAYQFLQALLSASDKLHISYQGKDIKDNSRLNPSALVQELLHYCTHVANSEQGSVEQLLHIQHPLFSFHRDYFSNKTQLNNFSQADYFCTQQTKTKNYQWYSAHQADDQSFVQPKNIETSAPTHTTTQLDDVLVFYRNTAKSFCTQHDISFTNTSQIVEDEEPLSISSGLPNYHYFHLAIAALQQQNDYDSWLNNIQSHPNTPEQLNTQISAIKLWEQASKIIHQRDQLLNSPSLDTAKPIILNTQSNTNCLKLRGQILLSTKQSMQYFKNSVLKGKDYFSAWLQHLAANLTQPITSQLYYYKNDNAKHIIFDPIDALLAEKHLQPLVNAFLQSHNAVLLFDANLSYIYAETYLINSDSNNAILQTLEALNTSYDPYIRFLFNEELIRHEHFHDLALSFYSPLFATINDGTRKRS